ncbi:MAG TPA: carbon-nitrogen hydrolase family protein [Burkholderiales bacterium]|nr:carbon-nitrogen hydrolase family protein [Burkholderiales bacterium]
MAAVQLPKFVNQPESQFISLVDNYIDQAKKNEVKIILFPELHTFNIIDNMTIANFNKVSHFTNTYKTFLKAKAISSGMIIIGGTSITQKNNKFYNTLIIAFPNGQIKTTDKNILTPGELENNITGVGRDDPLSFNTPWGSMAVLICYETNSPEVISKISKTAPNIIFVTSNTSMGQLEYVKIAAQYMSIWQLSYVLLTGITTNTPLEKISNQTVGQAIFISPLGKENHPIITTLGKFNQPGIFITSVDINKIKKLKSSFKIGYPARDYAIQHGIKFTN